MQFERSDVYAWNHFFKITQAHKIKKSYTFPMTFLGEPPMDVLPKWWIKTLPPMIWVFQI